MVETTWCPPAYARGARQRSKSAGVDTTLVGMAYSRTGKHSGLPSNVKAEPRAMNRPYADPNNLAPYGGAKGTVKVKGVSKQCEDAGLTKHTIFRAPVSNDWRYREAERLESLALKKAALAALRGGRDE